MKGFERLWGALLHVVLSQKGWSHDAKIGWNLANYGYNAFCDNDRSLTNEEMQIVGVLNLSAIVAFLETLLGFDCI